MHRRVNAIIILWLAATLASAPGLCQEEPTLGEPIADPPEAESDNPHDQGGEGDETEEHLTPCEEALRKSEKELAAGRIGAAYSILSRLAKQDQDEGIAAKAAERMRQIEARGEQMVEALLATDDPELGEEKLNKLYRDYGQTPVRRLLDEAEKQLRIKKACRVAAGPDAEDDAQADPEADKVARMWLIIGHIHRENGRTQQAMEAYRVLVYEHPESRFTDEARNWLERLKTDPPAESSAVVKAMADKSAEAAAAKEEASLRASEADETPGDKGDKE